MVRGGISLCARVSSGNCVGYVLKKIHMPEPHLLFDIKHQLHKKSLDAPFAASSDLQDTSENVERGLDRLDVTNVLMELSVTYSFQSTVGYHFSTL